MLQAGRDGSHTFSLPMARWILCDGFSSDNQLGCHLLPYGDGHIKVVLWPWPSHNGLPCPLQCLTGAAWRVQRGSLGVGIGHFRGCRPSKLTSVDFFSHQVLIGDGTGHRSMGGHSIDSCFSSGLPWQAISCWECLSPTPGWHDCMLH